MRASFPTIIWFTFDDRYIIVHLLGIGVCVCVSRVFDKSTPLQNWSRLCGCCANPSMFAVLNMRKLNTKRERYTHTHTQKLKSVWIEQIPVCRWMMGNNSYLSLCGVSYVCVCACSEARLIYEVSLQHSWKKSFCFCFFAESLVCVCVFVCLNIAMEWKFDEIHLLFCIPLFRLRTKRMRSKQFYGE